MFQFINTIYVSAVGRVDILFDLFALLFFAGLIRTLLISLKQNWVQSMSTTLSCFLLPMITYSITSVISGDIALSLGLVGALSIVRFRNPVKSSLELTVFFLLISLGIATSSDIRWGVVLMTGTIIVFLAVYLFDRLHRRATGGSMFIPSFNEANQLATIEVDSTKPILSLENSSLLIAFFSSGGEYTYRLASANKSDLLELNEGLRNLKNIKSTRFNAS